MKTNFYRPGFWVFVLFFSIHTLVYSQGDKFIHIADSTNIIQNYTLIDNPNLNGNPNAIFLVTANWNPGGTGGVYNTSPIGVWYDAGTAKWGIFNQDLAPMPEGAAFNIFIPSGGDYFVHTVTPSNSPGYFTYLDNSHLNGNPDAWIIPTSTEIRMLFYSLPKIGIPEGMEAFKIRMLFYSLPKIGIPEGMEAFITTPPSVWDMTMIYG